MFRIDRSFNRITRLTEVNFADLEFQGVDTLKGEAGGASQLSKLCRRSIGPRHSSWGRNGKL